MNKSAQISLIKTKKIVGKTLVFRDATVTDAEYIISLRTDNKKSRYLSKTSHEIDRQRIWLDKYTNNDDQVYFIIEHLSKPIGTVRLYDAIGNSFCWGSWILQDDSPLHAAIESALMVYSYAIDHLGFSASHFDVRKENEKVWRFHERFGARRISETELDYFYTLDIQSIIASCSRYSKFLPDGIVVSR